LLWVATLGSNLFERRIARVPEITPRAQVLLGKLIKATLITLAVVLSLTSIGVDFSPSRCSPERSASESGWAYSAPSPTCSVGSSCCWTSRSSRAT
jgi:hypothetical protein